MMSDVLWELKILFLYHEGAKMPTLPEVRPLQTHRKMVLMISDGLHLILPHNSQREWITVALMQG
jgi:hypothetical protein